jgi:hypothetical protein
MATATPQPEPHTFQLYADLSHAGLEQAIDRFRAFAHAHSDMEPSLRCERTRDGRRRWVIDVRIRASHNDTIPKEDL